MKQIIKLLSIGLFAFALASCSSGSVGPQGPKGDTGEKGADGASFLQGNVDPADSLGKNGDTFLNTTTNDLFYKSNDTWSKVGNIKGESGDDGASVLTGQGVPSSSTGKNGDSYIDITTWNYYFKNDDIWELKGNISYNEKNVVNFKIDNETIYSIDVKPNSKIEYPSCLPTYYKWVVEGTEDRYWNFDGYFADRVNGDLNLYAKQIPQLSDDKKTVTYGLYPQTHINDLEVINELEKISPSSLNGWYLYNCEFYAKTVANPYNEGTYKFDDNTVIVKDATYWFKCEPITWSVLATNSNEYLVLSSKLLDQYEYDDSSNVFNDSNIRTWLNAGFYNPTFALGNESINPTSKTNNDNVSILTKEDFLNGDYGFSTSEENSLTRECKTTDWARAHCGFSSLKSTNLNCGYCWTSTGSVSESNVALCVNGNGAITSNFVNYTGCCVRPILNIKLNF